jgi:hypothetical protein
MSDGLMDGVIFIAGTLMTVVLSLMGYHSGLGPHEAFWTAFGSVVSAGVLYGAVKLLLSFGSDDANK